MRLFVSIDLDGLAEAIAAVQHEFERASGLDFVDPNGVHVTLEFLGEVDEDRLDTIVDALERGVTASGVEPFEAEVGGLGAFPSNEYIRVLWVGVREGTAEMARLHEAIEARTTELGFEPDAHEFTPHATIARMRHAGGKELVQDRLETYDPTVGTQTVEEVRLTESTLTDEGPEYATVERFEL